MMAATEPRPSWGLTHVVRCHARGVSAADARTKVWAAAFLPTAVDWPAATEAGGAGARTGPAAPYAVTAGETSLAVHDVATGAIVLKYQHPEREDFYCAATTVLPQPRRQAVPWRLPVIAAAGGAGTVKLISPAHRVCYAELRGHRRNINALVFDPAQPRHLYSAGADAAVLAWDIGSLDQTAPAVCVRDGSARTS
jgi:hypothetical protein